MKQLVIKCVFIVMAVMWASPAAATDTSVTGDVQETGFSGIILKGPDGAAVKYWTGRETRHSPADWRPMAGDSVSVIFYSRTSNKGETQLVASLVELVKAGPASVELSSPTMGTIKEVGRSGFIVDLDKTKTALKFAKGRSTQYAPSGYKPAVGDRVKITFTRKPSRWGSGYVYVADAIERK